VGNIDNGPIEAFWGILKRERYYDKEALPVLQHKKADSSLHYCPENFTFIRCPLDRTQFKDKRRLELTLMEWF
jgi:transposase InsO family protein